jgi:hypothetical protein
MDIKAGTSKDFPKSFIPFGWPIETGFFVTIPAGPVPISGGVSIGLDGAVPMALNATMNYTGDEFKVGGKVELNPKISFYVKVYAGAGTPLLVYIGGYIKGAAEAQATGSMGISGTAKAADDFAFSEILGSYSLSADFVAKLSAGIEVRALYFFNKELFEVVVKEWNLGTSSMAGEYDFLQNNATSLLSGSALFSDVNNKNKDAAAAGIPIPEVELRTKAFSGALQELLAAIEAEGISVPPPAILEKMKGEGEASLSELDASKASIMKLADTAVQKSFDMDFIYKILQEEKKYSDKIRENTQKYTEWETRQNKKLAEAPEEGGSLALLRGHRRNKAHYIEKIEKGKEKYTALNGKLTAEEDKIRKKIEAFQMQTLLSTTILMDLESILDPSSDMTIDTASAKVKNYRDHIRKMRQVASPMDIAEPEDIGELEVD